MEEVIIATKNPGKAREFAQMFEPLGYQIRTLLDFPELEEVEETGATFEENAVLKAETISNALNKVVIADDSGLEVNALNGRPGVFSARFAGEEKNDEANIDKLLNEMKNVPDNKRQARFYCVLAVASPSQKTTTVSGECKGMILHSKRGSNGFGYDPVFWIAEKGKSMAELTPGEKGQISHRAMALKKLEASLTSLLIGDGRT